MESTGQSNQIQVSQDTADLLVAAGKSHWLEEHFDKVYAKGKGYLQTYFLKIGKTRSGPPTTNSALSSKDKRDSYLSDDEDMNAINASRLLSENSSRLIGWNAELMLCQLKSLIGHRRTMQQLSQESNNEESTPENYGCSNFGKNPIDKVKEIVNLPQFESKVAKLQANAEEIQIDSSVIEQIHDYVTNIAAMYRDNPFHNFEHASHVVMSVTKLLSCIVAPSDLLDSLENEKLESAFDASLHDHTYSITSNPMTQFACIFLALVHNVDHYGRLICVIARPFTFGHLYLTLSYP